MIDCDESLAQLHGTRRGGPRTFVVRTEKRGIIAKPDWGELHLGRSIRDDHRAVCIV